jgi:DNA-binding response OmpR family regulator
MGPILIIDDNLSSARTLKQFLETEGFQVRLAADRAEALRVLGSEEFRLVFLDLVLPDAGGYDLLGEIKSKWPSARVIAMSGDDVLLAGASASDGILPKPLTAAKISSILIKVGIE